MRLHDVLDFQAREYPEVQFAVEGARTITYGEALTEVNRLANAMLTAGLVAGDRVAVLSKNSIEYVLLYYGASKAGVALVPLNCRLSPPEWAYIINDAGATMLLAAAEYIPKIDGIRAGLHTVTRFVAFDGAAAAGWSEYRLWVGGQPSTPPGHVVSEDDDLVQMYTSGTTGLPKGAVLTHRCVTANMQQASVPAGVILNAKLADRWQIVAPVYHIAAAMMAFSCSYWGGTLYVMPDFSPLEVVRSLSEENVAMTFLVPAMVQACLVMVPDVAQRRYDTLRMIVYGASPIADQTLRRAMEVFGCAFVQGYGATETSSTLTYLMPNDHRRAIEDKPQLLLSAGRPLPGTEIRLVDDHDNPVPPGAVGEIVARGPQIMKGYWNLPEVTAETLRGGWFHTGDAGVMDEEGYIYIQDRVKDMIVSGGENVYPHEIEQVLFKHPAIADAAVIGVPDERWGEVVKAVVVLRAGVSVTPDEIMAFCGGMLGGYKRPRSVDFVTALPYNATGKVLKRVLREPFWAGRPRHVAGV